MLVYVNWDSQEVVGPEQVDELICRKHKEMCTDDAVFEGYLTEEEVAEILSGFSKYQREKVEEWFDNNFCEYDVK